MQEPISPPKHVSDAVIQKESSDDRRNEERRQNKCEGFTYIPMVGWYCRRDQSRRTDDTADKEPE